MAHIVLDLSSVEARNRFREVVSDILDLTDSVTERLFEVTKERARTLDLAASDYHGIMLEVLHERGGLGLKYVHDSDGNPALACLSCGNVAAEIKWLCDSCGEPFAERNDVKDLAAIMQQVEELQNKLRVRIDKINDDLKNSVLEIIKKRGAKIKEKKEIL